MDIQRAVSEALAHDKWITRQCGLPWPYIKLEPTNDSEGFVVHKSDPERTGRHTGRRFPRWQPQADDLLANDWILVPKG